MFGFIIRSFSRRPLLNQIKKYQFSSHFNVVPKIRFYSSESVQAKIDDDSHCIIKDKETISGTIEVQNFKAETKKLLDIVAKSLYSDKEIFIRELVSNASDALEKLRYLRTTGLQLQDKDSINPMEIHIKTDENGKIFIIQDTGVGMSKEEMINNLGTIAKSGSQEFMEKMEKNADNSIIGKFGVGFYSSFMVANKVDVYSKCHNSSNGIHWESIGSDGSFKISDAKNVDSGTKIILHLKDDCGEFSDEKIIEKILTKYSSYVNTPIFLNGKKLKMMEPLWLKDQSKISEEEHDRFYQYISGYSEAPRYTLSFKTDVPIDIKALFYIPNHKPSLYEISRESDAGVSLYSRKVMIMNRTQKLLPSWLRFMKGVVESDDIPLNLSRELLQDSALISKISRVITGKVLRFFQDQANKNPSKYNQFYQDFGLYLKEGIINSIDHSDREIIARLLRFESNKLPSGETTSLNEYAQRMKAGSRKIFFLSAPNRHLAETSPYMEAVIKNDYEILYLYEPYDEIVLMQLNNFENKNVVSIENEIEQSDEGVSKTKKDESDTDNSLPNSKLSFDEGENLCKWLESTLKPRIMKARITNRLETHPCLISVKDMGAVRYFMRTAYINRSEEEKNALMSATLELSRAHPLIVKLEKVRHEDEDLAKLLANQLLENSLVHAGLINDSRAMISNLNELLTKAFDKL